MGNPKHEHECEHGQAAITQKIKCQPVRGIPQVSLFHPFFTPPHSHSHHFGHLITLGPNTPYLSIGAKSKFNLRTDEPPHLGSLMVSLYIPPYSPSEHPNIPPPQMPPSNLFAKVSQVLSLRFLIKNWLWSLDAAVVHVSAIIINDFWMSNVDEMSWGCHVIAIAIVTSPRPPDH